MQDFLYNFALEKQSKFNIHEQHRKNQASRRNPVKGEEHRGVHRSGDIGRERHPAFPWRRRNLEPV